MDNKSVDGSVRVFGLAIAAIVAAATLFAPRPAFAQSGGLEATSEMPAERAQRGSVGREIAGGLAGYFVGGFAGMLVGLVPAKLIPPEDNNIAIISGVGNVGAVAGTGLGVAAAGNASGGNGKTGFAVLGTLGGLTASGLLVGGVGGAAHGAGADTVRNVTIGVGVPLMWAGTIAGGVLGYRWSAGPECCVSEDLAVNPYVTPAFGDAGGRAGIRVRF